MNTVEWHSVVAVENPPCREPDRIALGLRAALAIKAENAGLSRQRLAFLWSQRVVTAARFIRLGIPPWPDRRRRSHDVGDGGMDGRRVTDHDYAAQIAAHATSADKEAAHADADAIVADLLDQHFPLTAAAYRDACKDWWYA